MQTNRYAGIARPMLLALVVGLQTAATSAGGDPAAAAPATAPAGAYRPLVHFTAAQGWINDPNGLVWFDGEYHMFFQYLWPRNWGHAVSRDLVHWEQLPVAIKPDALGDIWSGSAAVDERDVSGTHDGKPGLVAVFTQPKDHRQCQSLAFSTDRGRTWTMDAHNPVIPNPGDLRDFRDPKIFRPAGADKWACVIATGDHVSFWTSTNLRDWTHASDFGAGQGARAGVWECPDLFELPIVGKPGQKRWVLLVSVNARDTGSRTQYFVGDFDAATCTFKNENQPETVLWQDYGRDDYAGVTWADVPASDGRRLWIAWMNNWLYGEKVPTKAEGWQGAMTLPHELGLISAPDGVRLTQSPAREVDRLRGRESRWSDQTIGEGSDPLAGVRAPGAYEIDAEFDAAGASAKEFGLRVRRGEGEETTIGYDAAAGELFVDRTHSGVSNFHPGFAGRHGAPLKPVDGKVRLRGYVNRCSVEVFGHDGRAVITDLIFPKPDSNGVSVYARDGSVRLRSLELYPLTVAAP